MEKPLVGISGKANAGKDSIADYLVLCGWKQKVSFAGNLKRICSEAFDIDIDTFNDQELKKKPFDEAFTISHEKASEVVKLAFGENKLFLWDAMTIINTPRELLQEVGTDLLRMVDEDCHVEIFKRFAGDDLSGLIIPDVRFPNEAEFVLRSGGVLIRVDRPVEFLTTNNHISETSLDEWSHWTYRINNDELGLESLHRKVDKMLKELSL